MKRSDLTWVLGGLAAALVLTFVGWGIGAGAFGEERDQVERRINTYAGFLNTVRQERTLRPELDARLSEMLDHTLGADRETVDSRLREELAQLAGASGLKSPTVTTLPVVVRDSPAKRTFRRSGAQRAYREEPDFVELRAGLGAVGNLESVVAFLHALDAAPWIKRITTARIDPEGDGRRLRLTVRLTTLYVPGQGPGPDADELMPTPHQSLDRYAELVSKNPFALPRKPDPLPRAAEASPVPRAPRNPRAEWRLTGIVEGPDGVEAWLVNLRDQRAIEIRVGDALEGLSFHMAEGDVATFRVDEAPYRVLVGSTLDRPLP